MPEIKTALLRLKPKFMGHQKQQQEENAVQKLHKYEYILPMEAETTMYTSSHPSGTMSTYDSVKALQSTLSQSTRYSPEPSEEAQLHRQLNIPGWCHRRANLDGEY
jgi:hypothetical protein